MDDIQYRDVKQAERLKSAPLENEDLMVLGRNQGAGVATDLDGSQGWPTQLQVNYDQERDVTVVLPKGAQNKIVPYKLAGLIKPLDVRTQFLAEYGPKPVSNDAEEPLAGQASEVVGSEIEPSQDRNI